MLTCLLRSVSRPFLLSGLTLLILLFCPLAVVQAEGPIGSPQAILYLTRPLTDAEAARRNTRARFEPPVGCYLGAFIDFDGSLSDAIRDQNGTKHFECAEYEGITARQHATYFFYLGYGRRLPLDWVRRLGKQNKIVHIALEPNDGLGKVRDDAYLHQLADDMKKSGAKIFLRFASEMNGTWTVYQKNPKQYREKYRLLYKVIHKRASNVALVWCPYCLPYNNYDKYYPGDDATDWVGVNMYSVTYHNNSLKAPAEDEHPCDLLSTIYNMYAARKPFMICEFAATHNSAVEGRPRPDFAARKITTLYNALPRIYPRVKCINYFDSNNMQFVTDRAYNDYSVTDDPTVVQAYKYSIAAPYFLSNPHVSGTPPPPCPMPIRKGERLKGQVRLSCWARATLDLVKVRYKMDGYTIYTADRPDYWECLWNAGSVKPGRHTLTLEVMRPNGKVIASQSVQVVTAK